MAVTPPNTTFLNATALQATTLQLTTLQLKGMSCAACANSIEKAIQQVSGVSRVQVNFAAEQASVEYDDHRTSLEKIQAAVAEAGYEAYPRAAAGIGQSDAQAQAEAQAQQASLLKKQ